MAVNLAYITQLSGNQWQVAPSGDGTGVTDSDNLNYVFSEATASAGRAKINLDAGSYYCKKALMLKNLQADICGQAPEGPNQTCIIAGEEGGAAMAPIQWLHKGLKELSPRLINIIQTENGAAPDIYLTQLHLLNTGSDDTQSPGHSESGVPWPNMNARELISLYPRFGASHAQTVSIAQAGNDSTLTVVSGNFDASDIGKSLKIDGASNAANNGAFVISAVPAADQLTYVNASGVAEAGPMRSVCVVNDEAALVASKIKFKMNHCKLKGELSDNANAVRFHKISNTWAAINIYNGPVYTSDDVGAVSSSFSEVGLRAGSVANSTSKIDGLGPSGIMNVDADIQHCHFENLGTVLFNCNNFTKRPGTEDIGDGTLKLPLNAHTARLVFKNNDCLNTYFGPASISGLLTQFNVESVNVVEHNNYLRDKPMFTPGGNGEGTFYAGNLPFGPTSTFFPEYQGLDKPAASKAGLPFFQKLPASLYWRHNDLQTDDSLGIPRIGSLLLLGAPVIFNEMFISHNKFIGANVGAPEIILQGVVNGEISYNLFSDKTDVAFGVIFLAFSSNINVEKNLGFKNGNGMHIVLRAETHDCSVKLNGQSTNVVDVGNGNKVKNSRLYTSNADLPPVPDNVEIVDSPNVGGVKNRELDMATNTVI